MESKKPISLSWDDFVKLGNPENAPEGPKTDSKITKTLLHQIPIKLHYEKKGRGGKEAVVIRGLDANRDDISELCRFLKSKLGVGGTEKNGEIIIQGNQRDKIMELLIERGYKNVKKAGG